MSYLYQQGRKRNRRPFSISPELRDAFRRDPPVMSSMAMKSGNEGAPPSDPTVYTANGASGHWAIKPSAAK